MSSDEGLWINYRSEKDIKIQHAIAAATTISTRSTVLLLIIILLLKLLMFNAF